MTADYSKQALSVERKRFINMLSTEQLQALKEYGEDYKTDYLNKEKFTLCQINIGLQKQY